MGIIRSWRPHRAPRHVTVFLWFWSFLLGTTFAQATTYVYDANGRLCAVTNSTGASSQYVYDALGNLIRIASVPAGQLAVFAFTPAQGPIGTVVTIYGQGFSATPASNTVEFNGTTATVSSATSTTLVAPVPSGATSGPISVTVSASTVTSSDSFVVTGGDHDAPSISGFTPSFGAAGASVTVSGNNLAPIPGTTSLSLNGRIIADTSISSLTDAQAVFAIPRNIGSGKIGATTPYGSALSTGDLIVAPGAISITNGLVSTRIAKGGSSGSLSIAANQSGAFLFDGAVGDYLSLQVSALSGTTAYQLYDPSNALVSQGSFTSVISSAHFPQLASSGTYAIFFLPNGSAVNITAQLEINSVIATDGPPSTVSTSIASQSKRLVFPAALGQNLGIGMTGLSLSGSASAVTAAVYRPGGYLQGSSVSYSPTVPGTDVDVLNLPVAGIYSVVVAPNAAGTMQVTLALSNDISALLTPNVPYALNLARNGQDAVFTFNGTAGTTLAIQASGLVTIPAATNTAMTVYRQDGSTLRTTGAASGGMILNLANLPATETYTVFIDPTYAATASAQVKLNTGIQLALDGTPSTVTTSALGESAYFQFSASAGQSLGLAFTNLSFPSGSSATAVMTVYKPDGTQLPLGQANCAPANGCDIDLMNLPATGVYSVIATPSGNATTQVTATLSSDVTASLTPNTSLPVALNRNGQDAVLTFQGTAGQTAAIQVSGITPTGSPIILTVYRQSGAQLSMGSSSGTSSATLNLVNLPATETYTVFIDPTNATTASMQVKLNTGTQLVLDGTPSGVTTSANGESAYLQFAATAGQKLGLAITGLSFPTGTATTANVTVRRPDNALAVSDTNCIPASGCEIDLTSLLQTGTYSVIVTPNGAATMNLTATLSTDISGTLTADTPLAINLTRNGQDAFLTFNGTQGQTVALRASGISTVPSSTVTFTVFRQNGTQYTSNSSTTSGMFLKLNNLPATETYSVFIDPYITPATASMQVEISTGTPLSLDGTPTVLTTSGLGESAFLRFAGSAGQNLGLGVTDLSFPSGSSTSVTTTVYRPSTAPVGNGLACSPSTACDFDLTNLPETGTYYVVATPNGNATTSLTATLSTDASTALTSGTPYALNLARKGQDAVLTFSGTSGHQVTLQFASLATVPSSASVSVSVFQPGGTSSWTSHSYSNGTSTWTSPTLTATGTYTVIVDPASAATATANVTWTTN